MLGNGSFVIEFFDSCTGDGGDIGGVDEVCMY